MRLELLRTRTRPEPSLGVDTTTLQDFLCRPPYGEVFFLSQTLLLFKTRP